LPLGDKASALGRDSSQIFEIEPFCTVCKFVRASVPFFVFKAVPLQNIRITMKIKINGKENTIQGMNSLIDLIKNRGFQDSSIVIEHNLKVIPREKWTEVMLRDGDRLEIVSFVGGG